jgi:hypothetical protein
MALPHPFPADERLASRVLPSPGSQQTVAATRAFRPGVAFFLPAERSLSESGHPTALSGVRQRPEAADVDHGWFVYPSLNDCPVVVDLYKLSPVGRRPAGGRHGRRLERFAQVCQHLPDRPWLGWNAISRMSPPHPRARKGNSSPTRAMCLAHEIREVSWERCLACVPQQSTASCRASACPPVAEASLNFKKYIWAYIHCR